jgi:hypothetical protein
MKASSVVLLLLLSSFLLVFWPSKRPYTSNKSIVIMLEAFHGAFAQVVELHDLRSCPSHMKAAGDGR